MKIHVISVFDMKAKVKRRGRVKKERTKERNKVRKNQIKKDRKKDNE